MHHVAILKPPYVSAILAGEKTIESRLSLQRREPFGRVAPGDRVFFKESSRAFRAAATVSRVLYVENLTPAGVRRIRRHYGDSIGADAPYWRSKRGARYATLLWLTDVRATDAPPAGWDTGARRPRCAWFVLPVAGRRAA